nr:hypothetical protein Iba_chr12dCG5790 [Ipomoea batatas]
MSSTTLSSGDIKKSRSAERKREKIDLSGRQSKSTAAADRSRGRRPPFPPPSSLLPVSVAVAVTGASSYGVLCFRRTVAVDSKRVRVAAGTYSGKPATYNGEPATFRFATTLLLQTALRIKELGFRTQT